MGSITYHSPYNSDLDRLTFQVSAFREGGEDESLVGELSYQIEQGTWAIDDVYAYYILDVLSKTHAYIRQLITNRQLIVEPGASREQAIADFNPDAAEARANSDPYEGLGFTKVTPMGAKPVDPEVAELKAAVATMLQQMTAMATLIASQQQAAPTPPAPTANRKRSSRAKSKPVG